MKKDKKDEFPGKLAWEVCGEWAKDNVGDSEWFRSWGELSDADKSRYTRIGEALFTYFRASEGNEVLRQELTQLKAEHEVVKTALQKLRKETGGR